MSQAAALDRLSPEDSNNLRIESHGLPMHVAGLAILDGAPLCGPEGEPRLETMRAEIGRRLHLEPRLRQVLYQPPLGLGRHLWTDDPGFDIAAHVRTRPLSPPGDEKALLEACLDLNEAALDRSRPLWEVWFLTGLIGGRMGMFIRLHHALADGMASVALLGSMFDFASDAPAPTAPPWTPGSLPSSWEVFVDNVRRRGAALVRMVSRLAHPVTELRRLAATGRALKELFVEGLAPRSSLNVPVGKRHRRLQLARADLDRVKAVAHAHAAKVNDVVLAAVAGGARELLLSRGELVAGLELRASVPVSIRGSDDRPSQGNLVTLMIADLPVGEPDPIRRLEKIARETEQRKRRLHVLGRLPGLALVQRALIGLMSRQRMVNLFTSNVPGPPMPIYFAGARVLEVFQVGVIQGNVTLSVGVLSYAGQLNFDIVADAIAIPDLDAFSVGLRDTLEELEAGLLKTGDERRESTS